jgi:hypothetical protein
MEVKRKTEKPRKGLADWGEVYYNETVGRIRQTSETGCESRPQRYLKW